MREAIGSSWLIYLVIIFILVYVFFIAFIMNYASAYRAANYVVTQIENCQAQMTDCNGKNLDAIKSEINNKYHYIGPLDVCYVQNGTNSYVFRVTLKVDFDAGPMGAIGVMNVRSETKTIPNISNVTTVTGFSRCK